VIDSSHFLGIPSPSLNCAREYHLSAMDKKQTPPAESGQEIRPGMSSRSESLLPPQLRTSVISVPVTPGINIETYARNPSADGSPSDTRDPQGSSYFAAQVKHPHDEDLAAAASAVSPVEEDNETGRDILRRMSLAAVGRRESLSEMRANHPELALSGIIISATFNIPHSLTYNKGADWVSFSTD
jgi:trehalose 6-phosphate synthase/phosphatase